MKKFLLIILSLVIITIGFKIQDNYESNFLLYILSGVIVFCGGALIVYTMAKWYE